ncbi:tandem-95 repeat protein [Shewanella polaris]|uniref:Tandem-95 repeat protein n=1 Tax=Shewanella polaris TaxID=2588449 RepID=A0A4Y5YB86_9GAMM|nr:tandem-95 repeat protein [Shewanella polaris]QDE29859.1 tandem-95 repeat protein [Shewanella polaris]
MNDDFTDDNEIRSIVEDSPEVTGNVIDGSSVDGPISVTTFTVAGDTTVHSADGTDVTITGVGTFSLTDAGVYTFTPVANYNGAVPVITYTLTDGSGANDTSTLSLTVTPVNDDFTDDNEIRSIVEDSPEVTGNVIDGSSVDGPISVTTFTVAGDTTVHSADGTDVTITGVGTFSLTDAGVYTFTPVANYNGAVPVITYTLTDGSGANDTSTLSLTVTPVNDDFTDDNEIRSIVEDSPEVTGNVIDGSSVDGPISVTTFTVAGDTTVHSADGTDVTITGVGTFSLTDAGVYTFTPVANYNGAVPVITYTLTDGSGTNDTSTLSLTVTPVNDDFTDDNEIRSIVEDSPEVTGNVIDGSSVDGPLTVVSFTVDGSATVHPADGTDVTITGVGTFSLTDAGVYTFTPVANYNGAVPVITYTLTDGSGANDTSTLSLTVTPVNDDFTDDNEIRSIVEDSPEVTGNVIDGSSVDGPISVTTFTVAGDTTVHSADGTDVTITGVGTFSLTDAGVYTFTPVANYNGAVPVITYTLTDGSGANDTSTLSLTVTPVNDDFTDDNEIRSIVEDSPEVTGNVIDGSSVDGPISVTTFTVAGDTTVHSADGTDVTITGVGTFSLTDAGVYTFTPVANYNGAVPVITYTLTDGVSTDTSTLSLTVTPVNDDFTDDNEIRSIVEDSPEVTGNVIDGSSVDGPISVTTFTVAGDTTVHSADGTDVTITGVGTFSLTDAGVYTFTPVANYNGAVPVITYTLTDGVSTDTSTLSLTVTPVNDDFTDDNEIRSIVEDSPEVTGNVIDGSSVDGPLTVVSFTVDGSATVHPADGTDVTITGVGTFSLTDAGVYTFTPVANYNGAVPVITYTLTDGVSTDTSTLSLTVTPVNDDFTDDNEIRSIVEDSPEVTGNVIDGSSVDGPISVTTFTVAGDTTVHSADGTDVTITGVGAFSLTDAGVYTFTPVANYNGAVPVITYTLTDGSGTNDTSTLSLTVTPVNDDFTDDNEIRSIVEDSPEVTGNVIDGSSVDGPISVTTFTVAGDTTVHSADGTDVTITGVGTFSLTDAGVYTFTPVANYNGAVPVITYTLTDGSGANNTSTLSLTVTPVNDDFTDDNEIRSIVEDSPEVTGNVIDGSSVDGPISVTTFTVAGDTTVHSADGTDVTITGVGTFSLTDAGVYTFTPVANYNGAVPVITYTLTDGSGANDTSTLSLTVTPVNDDFTDDNEIRSIVEDSPEVTGNVIDGSSVDGPISVTTFTVAGDTTVHSADGTDVTITGVGTFSLTDAGVYTFTPVANYNGAVPVITYTLTDGSGANDTSTLSLTVTPVNDDFTDDNEIRSIVEDSPEVTGNVIDGSSVDGPLTVVSFTVDGSATVHPADGTDVTITGVGAFSLTDAGVYTFTPVANYNGAVPVITYTLTDGSGTNDTSTLSLTVTPVNDDFTDDNEIRSIVEDSPEVTGNVIDGSSVDGPISVTTFTVAGDTTVHSADGTDVTITGVGTFSLTDAGVYTFTPVANYNGAVPVITYTLTDGSGANDTSTLSLTVTPVNDDFTDDNEIRSIVEDSPEVTGNVIDGSSVDGPLTVVSFTVDGSATVHPADGTDVTITGVGAFSLTDAGVYTFTPVANYNGAVPVITYTLTDGSGANDTSTLSLTVTPVNDDFTDDNEIRSIVEDSPEVTGNVIDGSSVDGPISVTTFTVAGDTTVHSADGTDVTITGVGTFSLTDAGVYTFTPVANYNGAVPVITYTLTDGSGANDTSTLSLTVTPVNDDFTDDNEIRSIVEDSPEVTGNVIDGSSVDGPISVTTFTVAGDTTVHSADGTDVTITGVGTFSLTDAGVYTFTPVANYNGAVPVITYTLTDGSGANDTSTLSLTVTPVNDDFTDDNEIRSIVEDSPEVTGNVIDGSSVDGPISVTTFTVAGDTTVHSADGTDVTITGVGTFSLTDAGVYTFTPVANYNGAVPVITYTLTDGSGANDTSTLSLTVTPVNDDFTDDNEIRSIVEDSPEVTGNVIDGSSVDGPLTVVSFTVDGSATVHPADGTDVTITGVGAFSLTDAGVYTFTPVANYNGAVPVITYTLTDGSGTNDTSTLSLTVTPVNDDFTDDNEIRSIVEDSPEVTGNVIDGSSVDGPISVTTFTVAGNTTVHSADGTDVTITGVGTFSLTDAGVYTFTPVANYNGAVPVITYTLTDGVSTDTSTLSLTVTPVNDDFTDDNEIRSIVEDSPEVTGNVIDGSSVDGPISVTTFTVAGDTTVHSADGTDVTITGVGTFSLTDAGVYTFTPVANYNGAVPVITYTLTDGSGANDTSTLSLTVTPVNDAPVIDDYTSTINDSIANGTNVYNVNEVNTGNDTDIDGDTLSYSFVLANGSNSLISEDGAFIINAQTGVISVNDTTKIDYDNGSQINLTVETSDGSLTDTAIVTFDLNNVDANDDLSGTAFNVSSGADDAWTIPQSSSGEALMTISARNGDGSIGAINYDSSNNLGVAGSPRTSNQIVGQIEYDSATGTSEAIVIDFNGLVNQATFSVSHLFTNENDGEQGVWMAYYNGQLVASETFKADSNDNTGTFTINTGNIVFDQLVFEATETVSEANSGSTLADSSDYFLTSITASGPAIVGSYVVSEDSILAITDTSSGLLNNDNDSQGHSYSLTGVNGSTITDGQVVTLPSGALLTIYSDGTYSYDTNNVFDALTPGELSTDTFTYTVTDQYGATDTATVTINIVGANSAPEATPDTLIAVEGQTIVFNSGDLVNNDSDIEGGSLSVLKFAPGNSNSNSIDATQAGASFSTALGGTITINADGTYSYQAPANLDHSSNDTLVDSFYYQATDGTGNSEWTLVSIDVNDTAPTAVDDADSIGFGGLAYGNVITADGTDGSGVDTLGADATTLISVTYENVVYDSFDDSGNLTIDTDNGQLIINQDGSYSYQSTQTDTTINSYTYDDLKNNTDIDLYGVSSSTALNLNNMGTPGSNIGSNNGNSYIGVTNAQINTGEALVIDLGSPATINNVDLKLNNVGDSEQVIWTTYDASGNIVSTGTSNSNSLVIDSSNPFQYIVLSAGLNTNYSLNSLTTTSIGNGTPITEEFTYLLEDSDGDQSSAVLSMSQDSTPIAADNSSVVSEAGLAGGTEEGTGSNIATGNLLDNDSGISSSTVISSLDGQSPVNGIITITTANGILTVYTDDTNGFRAGDYQYELTYSNTTSADVLEEYNYVIENDSGYNSNAKLTISIVDDEPVVHNIEQNLQASADPITTNLTLILDVSGSMDDSAGNGKTYLETAIESLTALINEVDAAGNVNIQIVTYSSSVANSTWLIDDIDAAINYLNALQAGGGTHYDSALKEVMANVVLPDADQSFVYFISDGEPTNNHDVNATLQTQWQTYIDTYYDIAFGIGIGDASLNEILPISYPEVNGNEDYAIKVNDADDLTNTILDYFESNAVSGGLGILGTSTTGVLVGADGGNVDQLVIDNVTYRYDENNPIQIITTALGATFTIDFETGEYIYFIDSSENVLNKQETFEVTIIDNDGDTGTFDLVINVDYHASLDANVNNIITNQAAGNNLTISTEYLTHGDATTSDAEITSVTDVSGSNASLNNGNVTVTAANDGDSFNYTLTGNGTEDSANVTIDYQDSTTLIGTHENDIIIANSTANNTSMVSINATVKAGDTYRTQNQFGFDAAFLAAGLSITQIQINLNAGSDSDGHFDISDSSLVKGSDSQGITGSDDDIFANMTADSGIFTATFTEGDFTNGDQFWFSMDTDNLGNNTGSDLASRGATFTITLSDQSTQTGVYISDGASGSTGSIYFADAVLDGGAGDDVLIGGDGNEILIGGLGDDLLSGGLGDDLLIGGEGNNTFVWNANESGTDTIIDFDISKDSIDLSDLLVNENLANLDDMLNFSENDGTTTIDIDADNDGVFEQHIILDGVDLSGVYGSSDDGVIINGLLNDGALIVDTTDAADASSAQSTTLAELLSNTQDGSIIP